MRRLGVFLAVLAVALLLAPMQASAHVKPNERILLVDSSGAVGGFANVQMNANHGFRLVIALKHVEPRTTYTVWLVNCAFPTGVHPCPSGPLTFTHPFGARSAPGCPFSVGAGPLTTVRTNPAGNGNSAAIRVNLQSIPAGTYYNHIDIAPTPCHPAGAQPPGVFTTATGFSFTV